jgi:DNA-binding beta-propeller fold protein YncE
MGTFRLTPILALVVAAAIGPLAFSAGREMSEPPFHNRQKVPPFPEGLQWINTSGPVELRDLRGKFVLMDFWTYCCINCMHILPELNKLEKAYPDSLVVIGVHSAKFEEERNEANIREAVMRYRIEHPVVNDADHALWNRFGVNSWPTLILIDPEGNAVWARSGEVTFEELDKVLKGAVPYYRKKGLLDATPVRFDLEVHRAEPTPLRFPGKVLADAASGRLFVADSNHNRIVVSKLDGELIATIGSGTTGRLDGDFATAQFNQPQGMALDGQTLYFADTENHLLRSADLEKRQVTTIAGTGRQARQLPDFGRTSDPMRTALNSPWDLWLDKGDLYIAMAGWHQIWKLRLDKPAIRPYAGNAREDIVDGEHLTRRPFEIGGSSFAQPSGLASDGQSLFVADSEGSSIRIVPLDPRKPVRTLLGTSHLENARLFTFGDVDGSLRAGKLQHPLGVVFDRGRLYVADTYNNKIKVIDPASGTIRTLAGTGKAGRGDEPPQFDEPAGLSAADGKLFVADTNNHAIRTVDLASGKVSTLAIAKLKPPAPPQEPARDSLAGVAREKLKPATVRAENGAVRLEVRLQLPEGFKINPLAPMSYAIEVDKTAGPLRRASLGQRVKLEKPAAQFEIPLPVEAASGEDTVNVRVNYYYCRDGAEGICKVGSVVWTVPLKLVADARASVVPLRHQVE